MKEAGAGLVALVGEIEAARALGVSVRTLQRWRVTGEGPVFTKLGKCVRYLPGDLAAFAERSRRQNTSGAAA